MTHRRRPTHACVCSLRDIEQTLALLVELLTRLEVKTPLNPFGLDQAGLLKPHRSDSR